MPRHINQPFVYFRILIFFCCCLLLAGCSHNDAPEKTKDLDFTIVSGTDIPEELQNLIQDRQENPFELTFSDKAFLYIIKGYGKQKSGGYNIVVNDFYQSGDQLVFDTDLFGPKADEKVSESISYPYIVIKAKYLENPVVFR
ncbi:protease complex subunit PrcB family protein [bacterium 1xD8-6]|jgi:hypothetical protein|nr:protease complex subunit PrcB family protein [bacterium D16-36]RKI67617.1 protease complex subunit PrcB family protein [bacterium 1xD8-6]